MIEPEIAFADIKDVMQCAEDYLKFCISWVLDNNGDDLDFFELRVEKGLRDRLHNFVESEFGIALLLSAVWSILFDSSFYSVLSEVE